MLKKPPYKDLKKRIADLEKRVSALTASEAILREKEKKYRLHFERISEVIFSIDSQFKFLTISPSVKRELGYRPEELIGKSFVDLGIIDKKFLPKAIADARKTLNGERLPVSIYPFYTKEGNRKWIEVSSARMVPDENDVSVVCVARDVSQRLESEKALKKARDDLERRVAERTAELIQANRELQEEIKERRSTEKALMESELKYRTVFDHSSDGISVYRQVTPDSRKRLVDCNMSYALMSGRDKAELLSTDDIDLFRKNESREILTRDNDQKTVFGGTFSWQRPDQKINFIEYRAVPVEIGGKRLMFSIDRDVTWHQQNEKRLRYLTSRLINAQEQERKRISSELHDELGQMLAILKHHLKSIRNNYKGRSASVSLSCETAISAVNQIIGNVRRLSRELSPATLTDLGLSAAIDHMIGEFEKQYAIKVMSAMERVDRYFSPQDQINLYRIFQEVLTNIGKHAEASLVVFDNHGKNRNIEFSVTDNGIGFDMDRVLNKAFEERGMGLSAMKERAYMLNGRLDIDSQPGRGTRIRIRVPTDNRGANER